MLHAPWRFLVALTGCSAKALAFGAPGFGRPANRIKNPFQAGTKTIMAKAIKLTLTEDEVEMLVDALEVDLEGYLESAKEARGNNNRADVATFTEAAERIGALMTRLRALVE